jgi:hypothetical protein
MTLADITERTRVSWPVLVGLLVCALTAGGALVIQTELKSRVERLEVQRESDREGFNDLRVQVAGANSKLDLLLQRSGIRPARSTP